MAYNGFFIPFLIAGAIGAGAGALIGYTIVGDLRSTQEEFLGNDALIASQIDALITSWNEWVKSGGETLLEIEPPPAIVYTPTQKPARNDLLIDYWVMNAALRSKDDAFVGFYLSRQKSYKKHISQGALLTEKWAAKRYEEALKKFKSLSKGLEDPASIRIPYTTLQFLANPAAQTEQAKFNDLQRINAWDHFVVPTIDEASRPLQLAAALLSGKKPPFLTEEQWRLIQVGVYGTLSYMVVSSVSAWIPKPRRANSRKRYRVT